MHKYPEQEYWTSPICAYVDNTPKLQAEKIKSEGSIFLHSCAGQKFMAKKNNVFLLFPHGSKAHGATLPVSSPVFP